MEEILERLRTAPLPDLIEHLVGLDEQRRLLMLLIRERRRLDETRRTQERWLRQERTKAGAAS